MSQPTRFTWIEKPLLAALAEPSDADEFDWLREQGIDLLVSLTEDPPRSRWVDDAGLLLFHVPVIDMEAPTQDQLDRAHRNSGTKLPVGLTGVEDGKR